MDARFDYRVKISILFFFPLLKTAWLIYFFYTIFQFFLNHFFWATPVTDVSLYELYTPLTLGASDMQFIGFIFALINLNH